MRSLLTWPRERPKPQWHCEARDRRRHSRAVARITTRASRCWRRVQQQCYRCIQTPWYDTDSQRFSEKSKSARCERSHPNKADVHGRNVVEHVGAPVEVAQRRAYGTISEEVSNQHLPPRSDERRRSDASIRKERTENIQTAVILSHQKYRLVLALLGTAAGQQRREELIIVMFVVQVVYQKKLRYTHLNIYIYICIY